MFIDSCAYCNLRNHNYWEVEQNSTNDGVISRDIKIAKYW